MTSPAEAERLNRAMEQRRVELDLSWRDIASRAQLSYEGLRGIRRGERKPSTRAARRIEDALFWEHGSVDAVIDGDEPTPLSDEPPEPPDEPTPAEIRAMSEDELDAFIDRHLRRVGEAWEERRRRAG